MPGESKKTKSLATIKKWVKARGGWPATVAGTTKTGEAVGLLRIKFTQDTQKRALEEIPWEKFYEKFVASGLTFLYQETTKDGRESRFFKFVRQQ